MRLLALAALLIACSGNKAQDARTAREARVVLQRACAAADAALAGAEAADGGAGP